MKTLERSVKSPLNTINTATNPSHTHPIDRPSLIATDAYPDEATNDGLGEYGEVDEALHLVTGESDLLQVLST